jgi:phosphoribosylanthranilate isomerase
VAVAVKICGCATPDAVAAAAAGGASYVGFVFYPPSPRAVSTERAATLARLVPERVKRVALFVDPDDELVRLVADRVPIDMVQLHGRETPHRVAAIKAVTGLPAMKAIKVAAAADVETAADYLGCADMLLFDAKVPDTQPGALPGGNAASFDWTLLSGRFWPLPWMLSGGLNAANLAEAVNVSGARIVDVSSGVESRPGVKDPERIRALLAAAKLL